MNANHGHYTPFLQLSWSTSAFYWFTARPVTLVLGDELVFCLGATEHMNLLFAKDIPNVGFQMVLWTSNIPLCIVGESIPKSDMNSFKLNAAG